MNPAFNPALILIDVQKGIDEADHWGGKRNNPGAEINIGLLLSAWRASKLPVIIVQHFSLSGESPLRPGQPGVDLKDFVSILPGEKHVSKSTTSAFINTDLQQYLEGSRITTLVVCGFVTNNSVEATVRQAGDIGFDTTVISDAVACFSKRGLDGSLYDSELVHQISLSNLAGEYASVKTTEEMVAELKFRNLS